MTNENLNKLSTKFQVTERTIWAWYYELNWDKRRQEIVEAAAEEVKEDAIKTVAEWKRLRLEEIKLDCERIKGYKDTLHRGFEYLDDRMDEGVIVCRSIQEVMQLAAALGKLEDIDDKKLKAALLLMGEADSRVDLSIKLELPEDTELDDII